MLKKFSEWKFWFSVCVCGAVCCWVVVFGSVYFRFVVRFCMVCGAVQHNLWCASNVSQRRVCPCRIRAFAGRDISEEEGVNTFRSSPIGMMLRMVYDAE